MIIEILEEQKPLKTIDAIGVPSSIAPLPTFNLDQWVKGLLEHKFLMHKKYKDMTMVKNYYKYMEKRRTNKKEELQMRLKAQEQTLGELHILYM